jgi:hypothetical protein
MSVETEKVNIFNGDKFVSPWILGTDLHGQHGWRGRIIKIDERFVWENWLECAQGMICQESNACESRSSSS